MLKFSIPFPPSLNHQYQHFGKKFALKKRVVDFRNDVFIAFKLYVREKAFPRGVFPLKGKIVMKMTVSFPNRIKRDVDNLVKATQDALKHAGLFVDDSQIFDSHIVNTFEIKPGGSCVIEIEERE